jgi:hypothetical protein
MLFIAKVKVEYSAYMSNKTHKLEEIFPVEAESKEEVKAIIHQHFNDKSKEFEEYFSVLTIDINPTLSSITPW